MFDTESFRRRRARGALAAAALAVAALGLSAPTPSAAASTTLTIAASAGPTSLDPTVSSNGVPSVWFPNLAYTALIWRAPDGTAQPGLAKDWAYSQDRLSFVMNLREGVKFSDGSPMTAADVVNWLKHYKEKGAFTAWLAKVTDIAATGPMQVTLKLNAPDPMLPYGLDQDGMAGDVVGPCRPRPSRDAGIDDQRRRPVHDRLRYDDPEFAICLCEEPALLGSECAEVGQGRHQDHLRQQRRSVSPAVSPEDRPGAGRRGCRDRRGAAEAAGLKIVSAPSAMLGMYIGDIDGQDRAGPEGRSRASGAELRDRPKGHRQVAVR